MAYILNQSEVRDRACSRKTQNWSNGFIGRKSSWLEVGETNWPDASQFLRHIVLQLHNLPGVMSTGSIFCYLWFARPAIIGPKLAFVFGMNWIKRQLPIWTCLLLGAPLGFSQTLKIAPDLRTLLGNVLTPVDVVIQYNSAPGLLDITRVLSQGGIINAQLNLIPAIAVKIEDRRWRFQKSDGRLRG